ncbi:MAG: hypothetical protein J3K34DRAFT_180222 [Monoraphidium minutum]|nr:MAG: hypothetical protein J3K34DRAFT_180222 [Monoraphidium minutum]
MLFLRWRAAPVCTTTPIPAPCARPRARRPRPLARSLREPSCLRPHRAGRAAASAWAPPVAPWNPLRAAGARVRAGARLPRPENAPRAAGAPPVRDRDPSCPVPSFPPKSHPRPSCTPHPLPPHAIALGTPSPCTTTHQYSLRLKNPPQHNVLRARRAAQLRRRPTLLALGGPRPGRAAHTLWAALARAAGPLGEERRRNTCIRHPWVEAAAAARLHGNRARTPLPACPAGARPRRWGVAGCRGGCCGLTEGGRRREVAAGVAFT